MKVLYLFTVLLITLFSLTVKSQAFPYLNASTGNAGQYVVDVDTNIIMYHGNQIEKLDKNFNVIWIKTYSDLSFHSLLLSKTGSMYFLSKNTSLPEKYTQIVGKINADGSLNWCKKILLHQSNNETRIENILLNRDNYLIASAIPKAAQNGADTTAWFIKLDTLGQIQSSKLFKLSGYTFNDVIITSDSSGAYRFVGDYLTFEGMGIATFNYSEISNTLTNLKTQFTEGQFGTVGNGNYYISKYDPYSYYSVNFISYNNSQFRVLAQKYSHNQVVWARIFTRPLGTLTVSGAEEDDLGNFYFSISSRSTPYYENWLTKITPNCNNTKKVSYMSHLFNHPYYSDNDGKLNFLYHNKYYYDFYGIDFPNNPLTINVLDTNLNSNCSVTSAITPTCGFIGYSIPPSTKQVINYTNYHTQNLSPVVTAVTNFSINSDYCLVTNTKELNNASLDFEIYPNPTTSKLTIDTKDKSQLIEVKIYDSKGFEILKSDSSNINTNELPHGLYLIKIKTDKGEFSQKFIKE